MDFSQAKDLDLLREDIDKLKVTKSGFDEVAVEIAERLVILEEAFNVFGKRILALEKKVKIS